MLFTVILGILLIFPLRVGNQNPYLQGVDIQPQQRRESNPHEIEIVSRKQCFQLWAYEGPAYPCVPSQALFTASLALGLALGQKPQSRTPVY